MNENQLIAELLFGDVKITRDEVLNNYPRRTEKIVTRFAPSPTGFLHIGGVFTSLIAERYAHQNNGLFYLRIEDTDQKRETKGSKKIICNIFNTLGIIIDEGVIGENDEKGAYGPYVQSKRKNIYHALAKDLVARGFAYPCFLTDEEVKEIRAKQKEAKVPLGIYRSFSTYRDMKYEEVKLAFEGKKKFVLRLRVPQDIPERVSIDDMIKGRLEFENNINDIVLLKEDGLPTYHFAHACDDYLMGTTHVIRSDEWMPSIPVHLQLFGALDFSQPYYAHTAPIMKLDGKSRRKLSKRKDPESNATFYLEQGYLNEAIFAYLLTLINSDFESWFIENNMTNSLDFNITFAKMSHSGALYDLEKLNSIASELMYRLSPEEHLQNLLNFARVHSASLTQRVAGDEELALKLLATQGENSNEHRKDLVCYSDYIKVFGYFYNDIFAMEDEDNKCLSALKENISSKVLADILPKIIEYFNSSSEVSIKELSKELGFTDKKKYEREPEIYNGLTFQFYKALRLLLTKQEHGISLEDIIHILGKKEVVRRLDLWTSRKY